MKFVGVAKFENQYSAIVCAGDIQLELWEMFESKLLWFAKLIGKATNRPLSPFALFFGDSDRTKRLPAASAAAKAVFERSFFCSDSFGGAYVRPGKVNRRTAKIAASLDFRQTQFSFSCVLPLWNNAFLISCSWGFFSFLSLCHF